MVFGGCRGLVGCFDGWFVLLPCDIFFTVLLLLLVGFCGVVLFYDTVLLVLLAIEIMCLAVMLLLLVFSSIFTDVFGLLFVLIVLSLVAVESAISLGIFVMYFRLVGGTELDLIEFLKG